MTRSPRQSDGPVVVSDRPGGDIPVVPGPAVTRRTVGQVVVLRAVGRLSDIVEELDLATRLALAQGPRGVVCDLSEVVEVDAPGALRGLAAAGRHPRDWPGVPVAITGLDPRAGGSLSGKPLGGHLMVTASLQQALSCVLQGPCPAVESLRLAPHPTAPRAARALVSRTLTDWGLGSHIATAALVVSELVTNAMTHAETDIDVTLSTHRRAIRVAVRDRSPDQPVQQDAGLEEHGRGLILVAGLSRAWGVLPTADGGKVVWATLD
jgi:Histidine kinase-like ATPase domain